jgi:hypothetical protein
MENQNVEHEEQETLYLNGVYEHFKGGLYSIIATALNSENLRKTVIYQSIEDGKLWTRDFEEFIGHKVTDEGMIKRFTHIGFEDASMFVEE